MPGNSGHAYDTNDSQALDEIAQIDRTSIHSFLQSFEQTLKGTDFNLAD